MMFLLTLFIILGGGFLALVGWSQRKQSSAGQLTFLFGLVIMIVPILGWISLL